MAHYVDGFVIPMPRKNLVVYRRIARAAGKIWKEYGALQYVECVGDDMKNKWGVSFAKLAKTKPGETVVFSWVVWKSKAARNAANKKIMTDPRLERMMAKMPSPFDMKRMAFGGFNVLVER